MYILRKLPTNSDQQPYISTFALTKTWILKVKRSVCRYISYSTEFSLTIFSIYNNTSNTHFLWFKLTFLDVNRTFSCECKKRVHIHIQVKIQILKFCNSIHCSTDHRHAHLFPLFMHLPPFVSSAKPSTMLSCLSTLSARPASPPTSHKSLLSAHCCYPN